MGFKSYKNDGSFQEDNVERLLTIQFHCHMFRVGQNSEWVHVYCDRPIDFNNEINTVLKLSLMTST